MRPLKLSDWAHVAEIVSAVAVVVSLLYVGYQIKLNTQEIRAANRQQLVNRAHTAVIGWAASPEVAAVIAKVRNGESLNDVEKLQFDYAIRAALYDVQEAFLLHREGRLSEDYWITRQALVQHYLSTPAAMERYHEQKSIGVLHQDFVAWLDSALEESSGR
jgi:hypothetical protein